MKKLLNKEFLKWNFESSGSEQTLFFEGLMTVWSVSVENKKFKTFLTRQLLDQNLNKNKKIIFDCQRVIEIDSSGLAMLLSCLRQANQLGYESRLSQVPPKALELMEAQGVRELMRPFLN